MDQSNVEILLIDDDEVDVEGVLRSLKKMGVQNRVTVAGDGLEGLQALRGEGDYDGISDACIVLLDLKMPRMNGLEFLKELRNDPELKHTIVFVLTTSDNGSDKFEAYSYNVAGYILKSNVGDNYAELISLLESFWKVVVLPERMAG